VEVAKASSCSKGGRSPRGWIAAGQQSTEEGRAKLRALSAPQAAPQAATQAAPKAAPQAAPKAVPSARQRPQKDSHKNLFLNKVKSMEAPAQARAPLMEFLVRVLRSARSQFFALFESDPSVSSKIQPLTVFVFGAQAEDIQITIIPKFKYDTLKFISVSATMRANPSASC
jgi:hypothetical protein